MTLSDVKNYFLNIGHSFYRSADFKDLSLTYKPISHYGIGFLSSFLLSDSISVKTTSYKEPKVCNVLRLQKNNRFVIQKSEENALPEAGTEIILAKSSFMKVFPKVEDIRKYISETFKDTGIKIIVSEDGQENAVSFTNQQSKNRIDVSDYLNNVECSCSNPLLSSKKEGIKLYGIQSVLSPFENTGECIYDAEYFSEKIVAFDDLYKCSKKEWALDGDSVFYANADLIQDTLKYDFENEKNFDYSALTKEQTVNHITRFVANIWQVHPFGEGNTRTTAVFTIMYLRSLGFAVNNEPFEKHSWYFRNALVRANYTNVKKSIYMNNIFLEKFFENLLLGKNNELKNRYTHIRYTENIEKTSVQKKKLLYKLWN